MALPLPTFEHFLVPAARFFYIPPRTGNSMSLCAFVFVNLASICSTIGHVLDLFILLERNVSIAGPLGTDILPCSLKEAHRFMP